MIETLKNYNEPTLNVFQKTLIFIFFTGLILESVFQYESFLIGYYYTTRLILTPCLFLIILDFKNKYKNIFHLSYIILYLSDIFTIYSNYLYFSIGMYFLFLFFALVGLGILKLRSNNIRNKKTLQYLLILLSIAFYFANFIATDLQKYSIFFILLVVLFTVFQAFALKNKRQKIALNYFIPFALLVLVTFFLYGLTFMLDNKLLSTIMIFLNGIYLFLLSLSINNIGTVLAIKNEDDIKINH